MIVLDYSHKGAPVRDIRHPVFEAATKKMGVVVADRYGRRAGRQVARRHVDWSRPDTLHGSVRRKKLEIFCVSSRELARQIARGFPAAQDFEATDEIARKIGAKSACYVADRPHQEKSRGSTAIPLVDGCQSTLVVISVEGFNALERKLELNPRAICHAGSMQKSSMRRNALPAHGRFGRAPARSK